MTSPASARPTSPARGIDDRATNAGLFEAARAVIPGGVDSPVRAFGSVGGAPVFIESAHGARVRGAEGRDYVDLVGSWGPALLGHAHPDVVEAVRRAAGRGLSFGAPTTAETELAEAVRARVPAVERVRFVSTGTEATMTAVRLARGATGRDLVVKFAGCYHGHSDGLLSAAGSGVATGGLPGSAGVPKTVAEQTVVLPYNDVSALEECFAARGDEIAAVITEPAPANMGIVPPAPGFNASIREVSAAHGALMIADEVLTGFRVGPAGASSSMTSARPPRAASGIPPPTTLPKVSRSGTQAALPRQSAPGQDGDAAAADPPSSSAVDQPSRASRPQNPAGPTRKPVSTSSAIMRAPWAAVTRRTDSLKPGAGGTIPMLAGAPSVMTAAISGPRSAKQASRAATSL